MVNTCCSVSDFKVCVKLTYRGTLRQFLCCNKLHVQVFALRLSSGFDEPLEDLWEAHRRLNNTKTYLRLWFKHQLQRLQVTKSLRANVKINSVLLDGCLLAKKGQQRRRLHANVTGPERHKKVQRLR